MGGEGGVPLDDGGLVKICVAVLALRWVAAVLGHLGVSHFALALSQLGDIALKTQTQLRVLTLGCLRCSFF